MKPFSGRQAERGISLIEIMIALTILSTALIALGGLMFQVARHTRISASVAFLTAATQREAARAETLPWDSIASGAAVGCTTDTVGELSYDACLTVQDMTTRLKRVTVVISPTSLATLPPETLVVDRNKPRTQSPFKN